MKKVVTLFALGIFAFALLSAGQSLSETDAVGLAVAQQQPRATSAEIKANPGELIIIIAASKGDVGFFFDARDFGSKQAYQSGKTLILTTTRAGQYSINSVLWEERKIEQTLITVEGKPAPPTPPDAKLKHVTFVGTSPRAATVVNDMELRIWLKSKSLSVHVITEATGKMKKEIEGIGGGSAVVLQDEPGNILGVSLIVDSDQVKKYVTEYLGS